MFEGTYVHDLKYLHPFIIYYTYTKYEFVCREDSTDWLVASPRPTNVLIIDWQGIVVGYYYIIRTYVGTNKINSRTDYYYYLAFAIITYVGFW